MQNNKNNFTKAKKLVFLQPVYGHLIEVGFTGGG